MPEIKRFGGIKLLMFVRGRDPPHVHIRGADFAAKKFASLTANCSPAMRRAGCWGGRAAGWRGIRAELKAMRDEFQRSIRMSDEVTRVTKARPAGGHLLHVRFAGERRDRKLDLTGLIARSVHFAPLMDDAKSFAKAAIVEDGLGLAWPVETKWGRLETGAIQSDAG